MRLPGRHPHAGRATSAKTVRLGLGLFLFLLIYDGALRKWVLPGVEQLIFIAKDALLLGLLVYVLLKRQGQGNAKMQPAVRGLFFLYAAWVLLESANYYLPNFLVGIWGIKAHLLYASLILLLPLAFRNLDELFRWLVKIYPWLVIPVCALAFVQLTLPAGSFLNQQVRGGMEGMAYFGEANLVRVTGPFSYISGMSLFVQTVTVLGVALFLNGARSRSFLIGFGFALAALPATGSRGVIVLTAASAIIMLLAAVAARLNGVRDTARIILVVALLGAISLQTQDAAWVALQQRTAGVAKSYGDTNRTFTTFTNAFHHFDTAGLFGFGSGAVNLGSPALVKNVVPFSWVPVGNRFEEESGRVVLELGIIGWIFSLTMRVALFFWAAKLVMKGRTRTVRVAAVLALPTMMQGMYVGNGVFAPPVGPVFYWFCVGLLAMAHFEHRQALGQRERLRAQASPAVAAL